MIRTNLCLHYAVRDVLDMTLYDLLKTKKCFKLVCAAANENEEEIKKLIAIYSKAGCHFFDLCAKKEILQAAKQGLDYSIPKEEQNDFHFCISVGIKDNQHISKAFIARNICTNCKKCLEICPQHAIEQHDKTCTVISKNCIGCQKCLETCPAQAISMHSEDTNLQKILPELISLGISCIELHISGEDEEEIDKKWNELNTCFNGILSICQSRSEIGDEKIIKRLQRLISKRPPFSTIIQTDGKPMSGSDDSYKTTLQTVAFAEIIQNSKLPVFIMLSGGTNSKTSELAHLCGVNADAVAMGSYARKIVRPYLDMPDLLENKQAFEEAVNLAKKLIKSVSA